LLSNRVTIYPSQEKGHLPLINHKKRTTVFFKNAQTNKKHHLQNCNISSLGTSMLLRGCRRAGTPQTYAKKSSPAIFLKLH
jgi:hypothetical protein